MGRNPGGVGPLSVAPTRLTTAAAPEVRPDISFLDRQDQAFGVRVVVGGIVAGILALDVFSEEKLNLTSTFDGVPSPIK